MNAPQKIADLAPQVVVSIAQEWRAGILPASSIARKYNVDAAELRAHAEQQGWEKGDLSRAIRSEALRASVERAVSEDDRLQGRIEPALMSDAETVRRYGQIAALVTERQKKDIQRMRDHASTLHQQLEDLIGPQVDRDKVGALARLIAPDYPDLAALLTEMPQAGDINGALRLLDKKTNILLKVVNIQRELIALERSAYGIDKGGDVGPGYDELLDQLLELNGQQQRNGNGSPQLT
jgi:hypothetical protein